MKPKSILLVVAAFVLGAIAAGSIGVRVIREVRTDEDATSLPPAETTTTSLAVDPPTFQVDPRETVIGSTVLIPTAVEASSNSVAISYDLVLRAPYAGIGPEPVFVPGTGLTNVDVAEVNHVFPVRWQLETTGGTFEGGPSNLNTRIARFDVDDGFSISEVLSARIIEARTPSALQLPFTLSADTPIVEVAPGVDVELLNISDQGSSTIVQLGIDATDPELVDVFVRGDGPGWRSAVFEAEGRPRINLTFVDGTLPDPIPLVASVEIWAEIPGVFTVDLGEFK